MPEKPVTIQSIPRRPRPEAEPLSVAVIHEDESLIAVDKPPGMVVHPTYRNWSGTLVNALLWHVRGRGDVRPRVVTRLDKDTSGLVLVALAPDVQAQIQRDAAAGRVRKDYLAIVRGTPDPARGTIRFPLARSADDRRRVVVADAGQPCETRYEVMASYEPGAYSLVRCELVTGRTHQTRVHLASCGWPILGDPVYGVPHEGLTRQALHAWRLRLPHPVSREMLTLEAPLPPDLRTLAGEAAQKLMV